MPVFRVDKNTNYSVMANFHFQDKTLSWKAKGILSNMLALPDDWDYSIAGLASLASDGLSATRSAIKELEEHGYIVRRPIRENGKIVDWEYTIFESPQVGNPQVGNPQVGNPQVGNRTQLNTNTLNTNKTSTNIQNTKKQNKAASGIDTVLIEWVDKNIPEHSRDIVLDLLNEWVKVRKQKRAANTVRAIELNLEKLIPCASSSNMTVSKYLEEVICRGWQAFYEIPNMNGGQGNGKYAHTAGGDTDCAGVETLGTML